MITAEQAKSRLLLSRLSPPTNEDWLVKIWYRGWNGKDADPITIRVNRTGDPITEEVAVQTALDSLRKIFITRTSADWALPPKVYSVEAKPRHRANMTRLEELTERFKAEA